RLVSDWSSDVCSSDLLDGQPWAVCKDALLLWAPSGYRKRQQRPTNLSVAVLTPPSILDVLSSGYPLQWHKSADIAFGISNSYRRSEERRVGKEWRSRW